MAKKAGGLKMAKLSQKWLDVLVPFSYEYNKSFSGSEISRKTGLPQRSVSRYLTELVKSGILRVDIRGNNNFYYLDLEEDRIGIVLNLLEGYKSFMFSRNTLLWRELKELVSFGTVVLFGSHTKGYSNSASDVDILILSKRSEKLKKVLRGFPRIQAHVEQVESFEKSVSKKDVLALEILKNHVIFGGIDDFVDLCRRFYSG